MRFTGKLLAGSITAALALACGGSIAPSPSDAAAPLDAAATADASACQYGPPPGLASQKKCQTANDCAIVSIPATCCLDVSYGVVASAKTAIAKDVDMRTASCPKCGCAAQPQDELGKNGVDFTVACESGACVAHAK